MIFATATFAIGAVAGGVATFGGLSLLGGLLGHGAAGLRDALAGALALAAALADWRGWRIAPQIRRQVPERWRWIMPLPLACGLYGLLLGLGFTTFVLSFAVWALAGISFAADSAVFGRRDRCRRSASGARCRCCGSRPASARSVATWRSIASRSSRGSGSGCGVWTRSAWAPAQRCWPAPVRWPRPPTSRPIPPPTAASFAWQRRRRPRLAVHPLGDDQAAGAAAGARRRQPRISVGLRDRRRRPGSPRARRR